MSTIEEQEKARLSSLIDLLEKISLHAKPCGLEANWSGDKWTWTIKTSNITAEEWNPAPPQKRLPSGIVINDETHLAHRKAQQK
jgi:hypothetical protein